MVSTRPDPKMTDCPALVTVRLIAGKWKTRILWHLRDGACGFGDLRRALPSVSAKVLTDHLDALVRDGLLSRTSILEGNVTHSVYQYSAFGRTLIPVLDAMGNWGLAHGAGKSAEEISSAAP